MDVWAYEEVIMMQIKNSLIPQQWLCINSPPQIYSGIVWQHTPFTEQNPTSHLHLKVRKNSDLRLNDMKKFLHDIYHMFTSKDI